MIYELSLKVSWDRVSKKTVEAADRQDLEKKIEKMYFWHRNRERITIKPVTDRKPL